ncbi:MAG: hypothetical protein ABIK44_08115, partial [candidate division WOR-3 bacterium]
MSRPVRIVIDETARINRMALEQLGIGILPIHITNLPSEVEAEVAAGNYERLYEFLRQHQHRPFPGTQAGSVWEARQVFEELIS